MPEELIGICEWDPARYLIISDNVFANLIYYSHLLPLVASLGLVTFLVISNRRSGAVWSLFVSILLLNTWLFFDLILWATENPAYTMFFWSIINMVEPLFYAGILFFVYYFISGRAPGFWQVAFITILLLPTILLTPTHYALEGFDLTNCDREAVEGVMVYYGYVVEIILSLWILIYGATQTFWKKNKEERRRNGLITLGTLFLLLSFAIGNVIGSLFVDWTIGQYGLFGIPIFVGLLGYLIVRYNAFNTRLIGAQVLVAGLLVLVGSTLFIRTIEVIRVVIAITLVFILILGALLIRGVLREIRQRQEIEKLAHRLEIANKQQVTLIHFITHQLKGFMAKSRNIFSMIKEGDYGVAPGTMVPLLDEGLRSSTKGAQTIEEILNASNIKSGKVTYAKEPVDLNELVSGLVADQKGNAEAKGLALTYTTEGEGFTITGDRMQLTNALKNMIDNAVKYTMQGSVTVTLARTGSTIRFSVADTGVGITPTDMKILFTEGGHGAESRKVNVESTGFGLYIVKNIVDAHQGKVWAESEGAGKGSTFIIELPVS